MKKILIVIVCYVFLFTILSACHKEYVEWGEQTNSNTAERLEENGIPYKIKNEMIYIPKDDVEEAIFCCS